MPEFVVISYLSANREKLAEYREAHLSYLHRLKQMGKLQMAGRFTDGKGGLYILVAASEEEAEGLAKADPYHVQGLREFSIKGWERRI